MVFLDRNTQTKILLHQKFQNQFNMQKLFINVKQMILLMFHNSFFCIFAN